MVIMSGKHELLLQFDFNSNVVKPGTYYKLLPLKVGNIQFIFNAIIDTGFITIAMVS